MKEVIIDTLKDSLKLIPFLFVAFLIIELIEHKFSKKSKDVIIKSGKFGPFLGGVLGLFPQCGFSVMATNLYVTRIISIGTLIAIYLSTSDEMLPILLSHNVSLVTIAKILSVKLGSGIVFGFLIDFLLRKKRGIKESYVHEEECHYDGHLLIPVLEHAFKTVLFILIISFALNTSIHFVGEDNLSNILLRDSLFSPFISSLIGLIPNCAASVMITELYLKGALSFGAMIAGLLTGSGVAIIVLFKSNKNMKENLFILMAIYLIGAFMGVGLEIISSFL